MDGPAHKRIVLPAVERETAKPEKGKQLPLIEGIKRESHTVVGECPGSQLDISTDFWLVERMYKVGRMAIDDFQDIGGYLAAITGEFEDVTRCSIYSAPTDPNKAKILGHVITMSRKDGQISIDESSGQADESTQRIFNSRTPTLLDYDRGIRIVFNDLDRNSNKCQIRTLEKTERTGTIAIMPFYYREHSYSSGVVVFEGPDLGCRGANVCGSEKTYWGAKLAMLAAAQISAQRALKYDVTTMLTKKIDFEVDLRAGIRNFKNINDQHGHDIGDEVIRQIAFMIRKSIRSNDIASRWGGEEFSVIVKDVSYQEALDIAERIRTNVEGRKINDQIGVTCSIGVADIGQIIEENGIIRKSNGGIEEALETESYVYHLVTDAFKKSDEMLGVAKRSGKNCIYFVDPGGISRKYERGVTLN